MYRLIMLGAPGSGKGTQAKRLSHELGIAHISTGELLRSNPDLPPHLKKIVNEGGFISDEMMISIVKERLAKEAKGWILDGFPRTLPQAEALSNLVGKGIRAIYLVVSDEEINHRLSERRTCPSCSAIYHLTSNPPKKSGLCDSCHSSLVRRDDDTPEVIAKRLSIYHEKTSPLISYFAGRSELITLRCPAGQSPEAVYVELKKILLSI